MLIVATVVVYRQLDYIRSKELGYNREHLVAIDINSGNTRSSFETIKAEFARVPSVQQVAVSSRVPGEWKDIPEIAVIPEGAHDARRAYFFGIDEDFLATYEIDLLKGRTFASDRGTDSTSVLLNRTAARAFNAELGTVLHIPIGSDGETDFTVRVIGIVEDYNFQSLHEPVTPVVLGFRNNPIHAIDYFTVRTQGGDPAATLDRLGEIARRFDPEHPFEFNHLTDRLAEFYAEERRLGLIFGLAAFLAILVACLGLFGLAAYSAELRTKEIGIRKVLGASSTGLIVLFSKDFVKLVGVAFVVGAPLAYHVASRWLDGFAYRVEIRPGIFLIAGGLALGIALLTVSYQSTRAAAADPAKSLRYE